MVLDYHSFDDLIMNILDDFVDTPNIPTLVSFIFIFEDATSLIQYSPSSHPHLVGTSLVTQAILCAPCLVSEATGILEGGDYLTVEYVSYGYLEK